MTGEMWATKQSVRTMLMVCYSIVLLHAAESGSHQDAK